MVSRRSLTLAGLFCLIPLFNFPLALVSDRTLFLRDIGMVWAPQVEAVVRQVARGDLPFFDARRGFGQPLFADPRAEVLYPPAWIHWVLPADKSYAIFAAIHIVLGALGAARLARRLIPEASFGAQATAGLAYGAGGPILSLVSHWHHLAAAAWMPWIIEQADPRPGRGTPWLALSALVALQILAGSPDYTFTTILLCLLRLLTRSERRGADRIRVIAALLLGMSMSAVQLLPSLVFAREAAREPYPIGWALSPLHPALTLETVLPIRAETWPLRPASRVLFFNNAQVWMFSHYLGLSVWALALLGISRAGSMDRRFAVGCIVMGLVFAWGVRSESLQSLVGSLPLVSGLRFPTKHLAASSLGLSLLAAFGVMTPTPWPTRARNRIAMGVLGSAAAAAGLFFWSTEARAPFEPRALGPPLLACGAVLAMVLAGRRFGRGSAFFPALVAIDLLWAHGRINPTTPSSFFRNRPPLTEVIPQGSRIYTSDYSSQARHAPIRLPPGPAYQLRLVPAGFGQAESLALAATWYLNPPSAGRLGYYGSFDLDILDFYRAPLQRMVESFVTSRDPAFVVESLRRGSVDYVVTMDPPDLWSSLPLIHEEARFFSAPVRVYKVPGPWPRARFESPQGELSEGSARLLEMTDGRIRVEAATSTANRLVIGIANDRGWHAYVDGMETPVSDNAMAFLAVPVAAGNHSVELLYRPPLIKIGAALSMLSLAAVLALSARRRS